MARHRSPRGRRATPGLSAPVVPRAAQPRGTSALVSAPVRRGAAIVAVTGGALSLLGAAGTGGQAPAPGVVSVDTAAVLLGGDMGLSVVPKEGVASAPGVDRAEAAPIVDRSALIKAARLAEEAATRLEAKRHAEQARAEQGREQARAEQKRQQGRIDQERSRQAVTVAADCGLSTTTLGAVKPWVRNAAEFLGCRFGEPEMFGVAGRGGPSDHPAGLAVDFMVNRATGDALAMCALENMGALGAKYVIWRQRINTGTGWEPMEDRGSVTANHMDHVHISFDDNAGSSRSVDC